MPRTCSPVGGGLVSTETRRRGAARTVLTALALATLAACSRHGSTTDTGGELASAPDVVIGKQVSLASRVLAREMTLKVYLPESYTDGSRHYPVLYTFQSSFHQVSGAAAYLAAAYEAPELIVVSVENYSSSDFSPERLDSDPTSGGADRFIRFFREELFPFVEERLRVHPLRLVHSGSYGGAFLVYTALSQPGAFSAYIAATPAIDYEGQSGFILAGAVAMISRTAVHRRWLFMAVEDDPPLVETLEAFTTVLRQHAPPGLVWEYHPWPEESHATLPYRTVFQGLRAFFSRWREVPESVAAKGESGIRAYHAETSAWFGCDLGLSPGALVRAVNRRLRAGETAGAVRIALVLTEMYPSYDFGRRLLGRAYESAGQLEPALASYQRAVELASSRRSPHLEVFKASRDRLREKMAPGGTPPAP